MFKNSALKCRSRERGFTLGEVLVAIGVAVIFAGAAFTTNQRLLIALKSQKETTAATMVLQQRMETFRATAFSNIANKDYVKNNILTVRTATTVDVNGNSVTVDPFAPLGSITEQITIGVYPADGSANIAVSWDASHPGGQDISNNNNLASANLLRVDVLETWTSANGRSRSRQLSSVFGIGNIAP
jgi:prepilin-type N-terminal cleavage/methylation domain-containing protein